MILSRGFIAQKVKNVEVFKDIPAIIKKYDLIPHDGSYKSYKKYHITLDPPKEVTKLDIEKEGIKFRWIKEVTVFSNKIVCVLDKKYHVTIAEGNKAKQCLKENQNKFKKLKGNVLNFNEPVLIELPETPDKSDLKKGMTITKSEAIKLNKDLAKYRRSPEEIRFTVDEEQIRLFYKFITHNKNRIHKFQVFLPDRKTIGPIEVKNSDDLVKLCKQHNPKGLSCLSVNSIKPSGMKTYDVERITNILFDVDVNKDRKVNGVSTEEDKKIAYETALKVKKKLEEKINLRISLFDDSGNGYHIVIPVNISVKNIFTGKNDEENKEIWQQSDIRGKLVTLEEQLRESDNEVCKIDCISKDIARRFKIAGSWNVKEGIAPDDYRQCSIIVSDEEAISDAFVDGNTKVFNDLESKKENNIDAEIEIPVDEDIEIKDIFGKNEKAKDLFNGNWQKYDKKKDGTKRKRWTKSESELSLCVILFKEGLPEEKVRNALAQSKIGKWKQSTDYQNRTIEKAKQFVKNIQKKKEDKEFLLAPNQPNQPNLPNIPNQPNILDNTYILSLLDIEKRPFQSIGRGIHNDVCYVGTYIEDPLGMTYDAVVTDDKRLFINSVRKIGNEWVGRNQIKTDFGLKYRDSFFADALDFTWSNKSIKKFLIDNYNVDAKSLFDRIVKINQKYMIYESDFIHKFIALDIFRSYFHFLFPANSRVFFHADKGTGKTNQLMVYRALSFNPVTSPDFSSSSIYRIIESTGGTILIDDFDQMGEDQKNAIIQHIRANYKPFKVLRADGKRFQPRSYNAYSHLVFNNVYGLGYDDITPDRCIIIRLLKHKDAKDITVDYKNLVFSPIRNDSYVCLLQNWKKIKSIFDSLKVKDLSARELELFKPLLAIAKFIDNNLYDELLEFAVEYFKQENIKELDDNWEFNLLKYLWEKVFDEKDDALFNVGVKEISDVIGEKLLGDKTTRGYKKKIHTLRVFIGGRLTSYLFKKSNPHNRVHYEFNKKDLEAILDAKNWLGLLSQLGQLGKLIHKNNDGKFEIIDEYKELYSKIKNVTNAKGPYEWTVNELCDSLGFSTLEKRKLVDDFLNGITTHPHNPTSIRMSKDELHYHLTEFGSKGGENQ